MSFTRLWGEKKMKKQMISSRRDARIFLRRHWGTKGHGSKRGGVPAESHEMVGRWMVRKPRTEKVPESDQTVGNINWHDDAPA